MLIYGLFTTGIVFPFESKSQLVYLFLERTHRYFYASQVMELPVSRHRYS